MPEVAFASGGTATLAIARVDPQFPSVFAILLILPAPFGILFGRRRGDETMYKVDFAEQATTSRRGVIQGGWVANTQLPLFPSKWQLSSRFTST